MNMNLEKKQVRQKRTFRLLPSFPEEWTAFRWAFLPFQKITKFARPKGAWLMLLKLPWDQSVGHVTNLIIYTGTYLFKVLSPPEQRISIRRPAWQTCWLISAGAKRQISLLNLMGCLSGHCLPQVLKLYFSPPQSSFAKIWTYFPAYS